MSFVMVYDDWFTLVNSDKAGLSYGELLLLCKIHSLSLRDKKNGCTASNAYFAELMCTTDRNIRKYLKKLKDVGLIKTYEEKQGLTTTCRHIHIQYDVLDNLLKDMNNCSCGQEDSSGTIVPLVYEERNDCSSPAEQIGRAAEQIGQTSGTIVPPIIDYNIKKENYNRLQETGRATVPVESTESSESDKKSFLGKGVSFGDGELQEMCDYILACVGVGEWDGWQTNFDKRKIKSDIREIGQDCLFDIVKAVSDYAPAKQIKDIGLDYCEDITDEQIFTIRAFLEKYWLEELYEEVPEAKAIVDACSDKEERRHIICKLQDENNIRYIA